MAKRIESHVIAGLGGPFVAWGTKALDKLFDDLSPIWDATHWYHRSWGKCADGIIERQKRYGDKPIVILVGHSYGALRCQQIATRLRYHQIQVDYIAGIDPTALRYKHPKMVIPNNVVLVDEFHASRGWPKFARRRDPKGGKGGMYVFPDTWKGKRKVTPVRGGHIACASNPITRNKIMNQVKAILRKWR